MPTFLLNPRVWLSLVLAALLVGSLAMAYQWGADSVQAKWDAQIIQQGLETQKLLQDARDKEHNLQTQADQLRKTKNEEINRLNTNLAVALDGLSKRPSRPSEVNLPSDPGIGPVPSGTGAGLYREDGEFLTREATRASKLIADLAQCQRQYNQARDALK